MLKEGTWWLYSKADPRWNRDGRGWVGMFMTHEQMPEAKRWVEEMTEKLGEPPEDLEFGYMKD